MTSKEAEVVVFDLPEDVVVNILCRLPVKSLIRFSCVSKRWRSIIISDSQFAKSTFQRASQSKILRQRLLFSNYPCYRNSSRFQCLGGLDMPCFGGNSSVQSLTLPPAFIPERVMLASCNGLVVLAERLHDLFTNNLSVWNPSTGFFRKIPSPEFSFRKLGKNNGYLPVSCGFGHVMATDEYKLVFFEPLNFAVHIFSTRDSSWKVIKAPHLVFPKYDCRPLLVSNGACHWVSNVVWEPAIHAFDLAEEEFRQLPLPLALVSELLQDGSYMRQIATQVLREGCLCVSSRNWHGNVKFWEMKEYGVPESWVKLFHFSVQDLPDVFDSTYSWIPVLVTEGGTVVINLCNKNYYGGSELVRIECHREEKPVCSGQCKIEGFYQYLYAVMVYDETLLSV